MSDTDKDYFEPHSDRCAILNDINLNEHLHTLPYSNVLIKILTEL